MTSNAELRIGLEATAALAHRFTGVQRYIIELARALAARGDEGVDCRLLLRARIFRKRHLLPDRPWPVRWYQSGPWPLMPHFDVYHGLNTRLPRMTGRAALVSTVHDVSQILLQLEGSARTVRNAIAHMRYAARAADRIIAVSRATKSDFLRCFDIHEDRIDVVYHGLSSAFLATGASREVESQGESADRSPESMQPYYVAFGGNPRKNLARTIEAFARAASTRGALLRILGGLAPNEQDVVRRTGLTSRVRLEPDSSDVRMARLYGGSRGLLYPSLLEGFGLPILEAMACGVPVLTSATPGTAEIAAGYAVLAEPESTDAIAAGIDDLGALRPTQLASAAAYARSFTWRRTADQTLAVYRAATGQQGAA